MDYDFSNILGGLLTSLTDLLGNTFLIIIYAVFIFIEEGNFQYKMRRLFNTEEQYIHTKDYAERALLRDLMQPLYEYFS